MTDIKIAGYTLPFFPMRPRTGRKITSENVEQLIEDLKTQEYFAQKKLNGDRVILGVLSGKVHVANRHGSWFKHPVLNLSSWLKAGDHTLLDGEVWQRRFYPFEALQINGENLMQRGPAARAALAHDLCTKLGEPWLFTRPDAGWLENLDKNCPTWEGIVMKKSGSPYIPLGSAGQESEAWMKRRWC